MSLRSKPSCVHLFLRLTMLCPSVANESPALPCLRETAPFVTFPWPISSMLFRCRFSQYRSPAHLDLSVLVNSYAIPRRSPHRTSYAERFHSIPLLILSAHVAAPPLRDRSHLLPRLSILRFSTSSLIFSVHFLSLAIASAAIPSPCLLPLRFSAAAPCVASPSHAIPSRFLSELSNSHAVLQLTFPLPMLCCAAQIVS